MERMTKEMQQFQVETEKFTDQILSMEGWFKERTGGDKEQMVGMMRMCYGDEFEEEDGGLREL